MEKIMTKKVDKTLEEIAGTEPGKIWNEIKDRNIEMFALPDQKVSDHCTPINIEPSKLYLRTRSSSVLPSLETSCGKSFVVELVDKYVTVTRAVVPLTKK
jgi:hypothetical protein